MQVKTICDVVMVAEWCSGNTSLGLASPAIVSGPRSDFGHLGHYKN